MGRNNNKVEIRKTKEPKDNSLKRLIKLINIYWDWKEKDTNYQYHRNEKRDTATDLEDT